MGYIGKIGRGVFKSFFADKDGFSARKLSAFVGVSMAQILSFKYTDRFNLFEIGALWLTFSGVCLGIVTIEQIIEFRKGGKDERSTQSGEPDAPN